MCDEQMVDLDDYETLQEMFEMSGPELTDDESFSTRSPDFRLFDRDDGVSR